MRFGIIFCGFNVEKYVEASLKNFIGRKDFFISAVSVPFSEYAQQSKFVDNTTNILIEYKKEGKISELVTEPHFIVESNARNLALNALSQYNVDYYWMVDGDEIYTDENIDAIVNYVENSSKFWYSVSLKNFVFDKKTHLEEPFCPPRIFPSYKYGFFDPQFYWDNDLVYSKIGSTETCNFRSFSNEAIPKEVAWVDHYTWLNDEIGQRKVKYQIDHFGHCSFKWVEDHLEFVEIYFQKTGEKKPVLVKI